MTKLTIEQIRSLRDKATPESTEDIYMIRLADEGLKRLEERAIDLADTAIEAMEEVERLKEDLRWMRQTVHQAHHEGSIEDCQKNTCSILKANNPTS